MTRRLLRNRDGLWPNALVLGYATAGWTAGVALLTPGPAVLNAIGVLLTAHSLVISAYLVHECAHNTIFADTRWNARLGQALLWVTGASYGRYEDIRHKHFRHHVDRADVVAFDFRNMLIRHGRLLKIIFVLEWMYIPAVDLLMHGLIIVLPFRREAYRGRRARVFIMLALRVALFMLLGAVSPKALLLYALAYLVFLHVLRLMDAHQHTYKVSETLERPRVAQDSRFDRDYEYRNTFSNPISMRHPWLNLLVLNFGYHNAHHVKPAVPWHQLPRLHAQLFGDHQCRTLAFGDLLISYHRHRVPRVLNGDDPDTPVGTTRDFIGVAGVSFLIAH